MAAPHRVDSAGRHWHCSVTWNSDPRATAPWWALFLGEVLFVTGIMLPMLWLRRASAAHLEKAVPAKANNEQQD